MRLALGTSALLWLSVWGGALRQPLADGSTIARGALLTAAPLVLALVVLARSPSRPVPALSRRRLARGLPFLGLGLLLAAAGQWAAALLALPMAWALVRVDADPTGTPPPSAASWLAGAIGLAAVVWALWPTAPAEARVRLLALPSPPGIGAGGRGLGPVFLLGVLALALCLPSARRRSAED